MKSNTKFEERTGKWWREAKDEIKDEITLETFSLCIALEV